MPPWPPGSTVTIKLWNMSAPAICSMRLDPPDGSHVDLGTIVAAYAGPVGGYADTYTAAWKWTIPADMPIGSVISYGICTYLGVERINSEWNWSVTAHILAIVRADATGPGR